MKINVEAKVKQIRINSTLLDEFREESETLINGDEFEIDGVTVIIDNSIPRYIVTQCDVVIGKKTKAVKVDKKSEVGA